MEYHALSIPCMLKGKRTECFAMERGRCRLLKEPAGNPCKFYKPRAQYEAEIKAADQRAAKYDKVGVKSWGKYEWSDEAHERKRKTG